MPERSKADVSDEVKLMSAFRKNVGKTKDIEAAMGCEGKWPQRSILRHFQK